MQVVLLSGTVKAIIKFGNRPSQEDVPRTASQTTRTHRHIKIHQKIGRASIALPSYPIRRDYVIYHRH